MSVGANKESLSVYLGKEILRLKYKSNATDILIGEHDSWQMK